MKPAKAGSTVTSAGTGELKFIGSAVDSAIKSAFTFSGDIRCAKTGKKLKFSVNVSFNDLNVDSGTCELSGGGGATQTISGNVTVAASSTLDRNKATADIAGNVTINGTWDDSDSTGGTFVGGNWDDEFQDSRHAFP